MDEVAILIPCYNEAKTVQAVIRDFGKYLPYARMYVYDNNSTDGTYKKAASLMSDYKLEVRRVPQQGKGCVVRQMFKDIDADIYLMVDGDSTYCAKDAARLIAGVQNGSDMVLGDRMVTGYDNIKARPFHKQGNLFVNKCINKVYHGRITDALTGYRAFSRKFVKDIKIQSHGFEIETELCIHALKNGFRISAVPVEYLDRPAGSESKLNTFMDGLKVLETIARMR